MATAIEFENVSKKFVMYHERRRPFQEIVIGLLNQGRGQGSEELWALKDLSFDVPKGEIDQR